MFCSRCFGFSLLQSLFSLFCSRACLGFSLLCVGPQSLFVIGSLLSFPTSASPAFESYHIPVGLPGCHSVHRPVSLKLPPASPSARQCPNHLRPCLCVVVREVGRGPPSPVSMCSAGFLQPSCFFFVNIIFIIFHMCSPAVEAHKISLMSGFLFFFFIHQPFTLFCSHVSRLGRVFGLFCLLVCRFVCSPNCFFSVGCVCPLFSKIKLRSSPASSWERSGLLFD